MNHYQNCRELVTAYMDSIKNVGVHRANRLEDERPAFLPE